MKLTIPSLDQFLDREIESGTQLMLLTALGALTTIKGDPEWEGLSDEEVWVKLATVTKIATDHISKE